jgi:selenium metabolism protein YedF
MASDVPVLDCRGKLCPKPLLETRRAIETLTEGGVQVIVDNLGAKENITRAMVEAGHHVLAEETDGNWTLTISKCATCAAAGAEAPASAPAAGKTVVFVADRGLGRSDPELGDILMRAFLATIADLPQPPDTVALMQGGVRLACEGSPVLEPMAALQAKGVAILVCGTCLDFFGLMGKLQVGRVSNMAEIVETLMAAGRVIPL